MRALPRHVVQPPVACPRKPTPPRSPHPHVVVAHAVSSSHDLLLSTAFPVLCPPTTQILELDATSLQEHTAQYPVFVEFYAPCMSTPSPLYPASNVPGQPAHAHGTDVRTTTPGCHFCKELQDTWQKLAEQLWSEQPQVAVAKLDCTKPPNQGMPMSRTRRWGQVACDPLTQCGAYRPPLTPTVAVCVSHNVAGFPTLRLYVAAPPCPCGARPVS